jgi:hypothetical protein
VDTAEVDEMKSNKTTGANAVEPHPLTIATSQAAAFDRTQSLYRTGGGNFKLEPLP